MKRIQRKRTAGWRLPEGAICVTRPGRWGNPFKTAAEHRAWIKGEIAGPRVPPTPEQIRAELAGHDLACWCGPDADCHANTLLEIANDGAARSQGEG